MTVTEHRPAAAPADVFTAPTVADAFDITSKRRSDDVALRTIGDATAVTWSEYWWRVRRVAAGLSALGLKRGDSMACMLTNRPEFHIADTAAMHLGAVSFSVYNLASPEQLAHVLADADARVVVTERQFVEALRATGATVDHLIVVDDGGLDELEAIGGPAFDLASARRAVPRRPDHADLHLGHDRSAEGRRADARQRHGHAAGDARLRPGAGPVGRLLPARGARRRPRRPPLRADGDGVDDHRLPRPERPARSRGRRAADPVRGRAAGVGEAEGRAGGGDGRSPELAAGFRDGDPAVAGALRARVGLDRLANPLTGAAPTPIGVLEFFDRLGVTLREVFGCPRPADPGSSTRRVRSASALKSAGPLIGQAACIGDGRPYNVALLVLDAEVAPAWAAGHGIGSCDLAELSDHPPCSPPWASRSRPATGACRGSSRSSAGCCCRTNGHRAGTSSRRR
jgi:hypothetical protein